MEKDNFSSACSCHFQSMLQAFLSVAEKLEIKLLSHKQLHVSIVTMACMLQLRQQHKINVPLQGLK